MKYIFILFTLISFETFAATCTTTTRTNFSNGQVLTSTALNADLNQLVTKVNSLDGGCVTDGTLEAASLNATDFATVTNGIHQGCALTYVDANTVGVRKCILSVDGNFVKTTSQTNVTWGCTDCSAEAANTQYYVYARATSTGTTLNLLISTTAPGVDGYNATFDKVLGRIFNNNSSAIDQYSLDAWSSIGFSATDGVSATPGLTSKAKSFKFSYGTTNATTVCSANPCTYLDQIGDHVSSVGMTGIAGEYTVTLASTFQKMKCTGNVSLAASAGYVIPVNTATASTFVFTTIATNGTAATNSYGTIDCLGY